MSGAIDAELLCIEGHLANATKIDFMRYFLDFTHGVQKEALDAFHAKIGEERCIDTDCGECMTRKRVRVAKADEKWIDEETQTRTATALVSVIHRCQNFFRIGSHLRKICKIQRWYRIWRRMFCVNNTEDESLYKGRGQAIGLPRLGFLRRGGVPVICAITQDTIPISNSFKLVGPCGVVYAYTCSDLIRYIRSTHKFECPATRNQIGITDVRRLQRRALQLCVNSGKDLVAEYNRRGSEHEETVQNNYALTGLESSATETFDRAVTLCEYHPPPEDLLSRLEGDILPEWREYVRMLLSMDVEACLAMLRTEETRIERLISRGLDAGHFMGYLHSQLQEYISMCCRRLRNNDFEDGMTHAFMNLPVPLMPPGHRSFANPFMNLSMPRNRSGSVNTPLTDRSFERVFTYLSRSSE